MFTRLLLVSRLFLHDLTLTAIDGDMPLPRGVCAFTVVSTVTHYEVYRASRRVCHDVCLRPLCGTSEKGELIQRRPHLLSWGSRSRAVVASVGLAVCIQVGEG